MYIHYLMSAISGVSNNTTNGGQYLDEQRTLFGADILWNRKASGGLVIPPSHFTLDQVTAAVSVKRISQIGFDKLLLGHQDNAILENAQSVVQDAAKNIIHRLKQSQRG